ncbi:MAG: chromosome segregation protein SMC [Syntrophales bacterium]|nr:chromosome segregation protein SMC [Syntrophales bacterium]
MKLKRLEISGFKSFRDKVDLDFSEGVSAIVGPNGCGKSNVVDALRWVMGEQRVKSLRGKKMDDVIFNGSQEASPIGKAEVSMVLACTDGQIFPGIYSTCTEVSVSRKLFRDGESEYAINTIPCRLLDVKEFFMGTGVGTRTYSLVEQNSVAGLVEAKPEERRQFIEEAAGVSKYKSRKEAAVRKMEATKQNLLRLNDVLREVKNQLNAVSRQAKRAEQYRTLKKAIKDGELALAFHSYSDLRHEKETIDTSRKALEVRLSDTATSLQGFEASSESVKMEILEQETLRSRCQEELYQCKNQIHLKEQAIEFSRGKVADTLARSERNQADIEESRGRLEAIDDGLAGLKVGLEKMDGDVEKAHGEIHAAQMMSDENRLVERELQKKIEEQKSQYIDLAAEKAKLKNMTVNLSKALEDLGRRKDREERDMAENRQRRERLAGQLTAVRGALAEDESALDVLAARRDAADDEQELAKGELQEVEERIADIKEGLSSKSSRLSSLKEFHEGYAWCSDATKSLMTASAGNTTDRDLSRGQFIGLVADCLSVPPAYEAAVEAVLGDKLQYIIVKSHEDGVQAIDYLKRCTLGRSSFVPVEVRNGKAEKMEWDHLKSAVRLIDHINVEESYKSISEYLLGDILLISDLRSGLSLWSQNGFRGTFVTADGDMISPRGVLAGGSSKNGERSLLKDKREIRELEGEIAELSRALDEEMEGKKRLGSLLIQWKEELSIAAAEIHRTELRLNGRRKDLERFEDEGRRLEQTIRTLEFNGETLRQEETEVGKRLQNVREGLLSQEEREAAMNAAIADLNETLAALRLELEGKEQSLTGMKVTLASLEEKRRSSRKELDALAVERGTIIRKIENAVQESESSARQINELSRRLDEDKSLLAELYRSLGELEKSLDEKKNVSLELEGTLKEWDAKIREAKKCHNEISDQIGKLEMSGREITYQMDNLCRMITEKYNLDLSSPVEEIEKLDAEAVSALTERLQKDRQAVETFGEVNLLAINEHEELKGRHDFLTAQAADLNGSLGALQRTISRINRISRERFAETFEAINLCFQDVFARIFPGGKGELRLTDETDLLETGVDIEIRIPGKRLQSISLLSGGEKSLAALALILAIILYRPTPFLVLDEVDAALDDTNVTLFNNLIREIAVSSQVIMVTHNKRSMEVASNLYGVTMQKKGISTTVSVNLN